jgi:hypothetical protein
MAAASCPVTTPVPRLVVFNRVPKCGSTSLELLIRRQAQRHRFFTFLRATDYVNSSLSLEQQRSYAEELTRLARRRRTLYDRHVMYVDFSAFRLPQPVYINLLRDPARMQVSAFYFWRECMCAEGTSRPRSSPRFCAAARRGMAVARAAAVGAGTSKAALCRPTFTIDELYANVTPRPRVGLMTRWFCGRGASCGAAVGPASPAVREAALKRAVHTMRERYLWIGIEDLPPPYPLPNPPSLPPPSPLPLSGTSGLASWSAWRIRYVFSPMCSLPCLAAWWCHR